MAERVERCLLCAGADEDERFDYCRACGRTSNGLLLAMANALHAGLAEFVAPMDFSDDQWARLQAAAVVIREGCSS